jgi:hypothetical protein
LTGPFVRPPLYQMVMDRESNYLILVPFSVPTAMEALLYFNSAKSYSVCLDDHALFAKDVFDRQENPTRLERVKLKAGFHRLLIKVHAQRGADGINVALLDSRGDALKVDWVNSIQTAVARKPAGFSDEGESRGSFWTSFPKSDPRFKGFEALWYRWQGDVASGRLMMEDAASRDPKCLPWNLWVAQT